MNIEAASVPGRLRNLPATPGGHCGGPLCPCPPPEDAQDTCQVEKKQATRGQPIERELPHKAREVPLSLPWQVFLCTSAVKKDEELRYPTALREWQDGVNLELNESGEQTETALLKVGTANVMRHTRKAGRVCCTSATCWKAGFAAPCMHFKSF